MSKVLNIRYYKAGYEVRTKLVDGANFGGEDFEMKRAYTDNGHYIGESVEAFRLCKRDGIKPELIDSSDTVCSIGFCEKEQKWYGWSHRARYGFSIGHTVKKGNIGFTSSSVDELYDKMVTPDDNGWAWQEAENVEKLENGVRIRHKMIEHTAKNDETGELTGWVEVEPKYQFIKTGRGEWTAETLSDCKQMAIDFVNDVA